MNTTQSIRLGALAGILGIAALAGSSVLGDAPPQGGPTPPSIPSDTYGQPVELVHAQRFDLDTPARHEWRVGRPLYDAGWLLVFKTHPGLLVPRQGLEPVFYVGEQTAERVNAGFESGHLVAIVPGEFFLANTLAFFGRPALPEEIGSAHIADEQDLARRNGVPPLAADAVGVALRDSIRVADVNRLRRAAIDLVERYSPQERDLIDSMRVPLLR